MTKSRRPPTGRTNLASCIVATIFLLFIIIIVLIVFFTVFKPKDPKITVNAVQLPSFAISNNTVNFTFSQYVSVKNPNKAVFSHYDSTLQLLYLGSQVGFMFIPAGKIEPGRTQYMAATFAVQSFPLSTSPDAAVNVGPTLTDRNNGGFGANGNGFSRVGPTLTDGNNGGFGANGVNGNGFSRVGPTMEIESRIKMAGRVRVLHFFTHHLEAKTACRVAVAVSDGSVLGFHC